MTIQQLKDLEDEWEFCSEDAKYLNMEYIADHEPTQQSEKSKTNPATSSNICSYDENTTYKSDEESDSDSDWVAANEEFFRKEKVFENWRLLDKQFARYLSSFILKSLGAGIESREEVLTYLSRPEDEFRLVSIEDFDISKEVGTQYLHPSSYPEYRLRNVETQVAEWLERFDWELCHLSIDVNDSEQVILRWEVIVPDDWSGES